MPGLPRAPLCTQQRLRQASLAACLRLPACPAAQHGGCAPPELHFRSPGLPSPLVSLEHSSLSARRAGLQEEGTTSEHLWLRFLPYGCLSPLAFSTVSPACKIDGSLQVEAVYRKWSFQTSRQLSLPKAPRMLLYLPWPLGLSCCPEKTDYCPVQSTCMFPLSRWISF